jgi:hypothetical protein
MGLIRGMTLLLLVSTCGIGVSSQQVTTASGTTVSSASTRGSVLLLRGSGKFSVNGTEMPMTGSVFLDDVVDTATTSPVRFSSEGNTLVVAPDTNFKALKNAYRLEKGASRVATFTGMTAQVDCFSITPVTPVLETRYEVNWTDRSVWVYARAEDVYIYRHGAGDTVLQKWLVKQGKVARIREARLCKPLVDIYPLPELPYAEAFGAWSAAIVLAETYPWHKRDASPDHVTNTH